jgi:hypothetical protein
MAGSSANYDVLDPTGKTIAAQWPDLHEFLGAYVKLIAAMLASGSAEPADDLDGFVLGNVAWRIWFDATDIVIDENTGSVPSPVWTTRFTVSAGGGVTVSAHAATHQHGGSDEIATATPAANVIPKVGAGSTLADGFVAASNVTQHEASIDHDALTNFVANEHIDHSGVSITAGTGLSGGGTIAATRTLNVVPLQRLYAKNTTSQTGIGSGEVDITALTGLTIPGADGVKKYSLNATVNVDLGSSTTAATLRVYTGANGTLADTQQLIVINAGIGANSFSTLHISGFELTPATGDKIGLSITFNNATANTVQGAAGYISFLELVEILA